MTGGPFQQIAYVQTGIELKEAIYYNLKLSKMGKTSQSAEIENQKQNGAKTKEVAIKKKQKGAKKQGRQSIQGRDNQEINERSNQEVFIADPEYETIKIGVTTKLALVSSIYKDLQAHGMNKSDIERTSRVGAYAIKEAQKLITSYVIDSQNQIFDAQRVIFKRISDIERAQEKIKNILTENKSVDKDSISSVMASMDKKIEQLKQEIQGMNQIVEKGDRALGKSSASK